MEGTAEIATRLPLVSDSVAWLHSMRKPVLVKTERARKLLRWRPQHTARRTLEGMVSRYREGLFALRRTAMCAAIHWVGLNWQDGSSGLSRMRIHGGARDGIRAGPLPTVWGAAHADVCEFRALSEDELKDEMERQIRMEEQRRKAPL